jgi:hypothetical protein
MGSLRIKEVMTAMDSIYKVYRNVKKVVNKQAMSGLSVT